MKLKNLVLFDIEESEKENFTRYLLADNLNRGRILAKVLIAFEGLFLAIGLISFWLKVDDRFNFGIYLSMYLLMIVINVFFLLLTGKIPNLKDKPIKQLERIENGIITYITLIMCWGSIISLMDQKLYGHLMVFMVNMITCSILFYLENKKLLIPFFCATLIISAGLPFFQSSSDVLIGHYVNLSVFIIVSWLASRTIFISYCNDYRSNKIIQLDKIKDEFLANTSHELRTPLNGIINVTESMIKGAAGNLNPLQMQNLQVVVDSSRRLSNLINDILDVSSIKRNEIKLNLKPVDIKVLAGTVIFVLEYLRGEKNIVFENRIPSELPAALCDEERLRQILFNLLGNALKFTKKGCIALDAKLSGDEIIVSVEDTGIGIPRDRLASIYNSFAQLDASLERQYEGTGLGLYITRGLVKLHGGEIWIESELGRGSRFYFTLPRAREKAANIDEVGSPYVKMDKILEADVEPEKKLDSYNILAVDDDEASLKALINILSLDGYTVKGLTSGYEAVRLLDQGIGFELIILDVMMPGVSGYEVLTRIREKYLPVELPVLLLTARRRTEDISAGFRSGANDYLVKPFEADELSARVRSLVQLKKAIGSLISSELSFLQAQIKPHFIFNTLSVISSLSLKEPAKAKKVILDLSDYLRASFDFDSVNGFTTLRRELELVRTYLAIEQERFEERLQVEYVVDGSIDCKIPILTIQPLVENALKHGIMKKLEGGKISISVHNEGECVRVAIHDNGIGIAPDINKELLAGEARKGSVGLKNIHKRLMSMYGQGLTISGQIGKGTNVEFLIPIQ